MTKFEFFVSNGAPSPANSAARSHAIKTGLQLRSKLGAGEGMRDGAAESKRTAQSKTGLSGRFRLGSDATNKTALNNKKNRNRNGKPSSKPVVELVGRRCLVATSPMCNKQDGQGEVIVYAGTNFNQRCFNDSNCTSGVEWIGRNFFDPFHTLPIPWNPRVDALIKHFIVGFDYLTTTVPSNQTWLALAMSDPLLLRVTLCMAAGFRGSQLPNFCPDLRKEGWRLKGEAIKEVNIALQEGRVTENLLAGIAHLGHLAGLDGSPEEADIHFQGLHRLITLRGGIQAIKTYQVGRFINWIDIELATARGRKPLYPLNFGLDKARLPACITEACETPSLSHLQDLGPGHENIIVVIKLHRQRVLTTRCNMDQTLRDIRTLSFSSTLLALNHVTHIPATPEESCILTMLLATLLFGFATLTQHHWIRCLPQIVAKRLRNSLQTGPEYSATWANYIPELFWILFVGSVIEAEDPQREETWFLSQLEEVWPLLHCKTRIELEAYLYSMVWDDKFGKAFIQTWCNDHNLL